MGKLSFEQRSQFDDITLPLPSKVIAFGSQADHKVVGLEKSLNTRSSAHTRDSSFVVNRAGDPEELDDVELMVQNDEALMHLIAVAQLLPMMQTTQDIKVACDVLMYQRREKEWKTLLKPKDHSEVCGYLTQYDIEHSVSDPHWRRVIKMAAVANIAIYRADKNVGVLSSTTIPFYVKPFNLPERCMYHATFDISLMKTNGAFFIQEERMRGRVLEIGGVKRTEGEKFNARMDELNATLLGHPSDALLAMTFLQTLGTQRYDFMEPYDIFSKLKHFVGWNKGDIPNLMKSKWFKMNRVISGGRSVLKV